MGMSVGMALRGLHPIAEIMFGDFVALAADQIVNHAAKHAAMYNDQVTVPLVLRTPMGGGRGYGQTQSQSLERLFLGIPHPRIVAASHLHDASALLRQAVADPEPVIFVEHKLLYPLAVTSYARSVGRAWSRRAAYTPTTVCASARASLSSQESRSAPTP